jgi:hypothetical protein
MVWEIHQRLNTWHRTNPSLGRALCQQRFHSLDFHLPARVHTIEESNHLKWHDTVLNHKDN